MNVRDADRVGSAAAATLSAQAEQATARVEEAAADHPARSGAVSAPMGFATSGDDAWAAATDDESDGDDVLEVEVLSPIDSTGARRRRRRRRRP